MMGLFPSVEGKGAKILGLNSFHFIISLLKSTIRAAFWPQPVELNTPEAPLTLMFRGFGEASSYMWTTLVPGFIHTLPGQDIF